MPCQWHLPTKEELELFLKLINVKGLGPKMANGFFATGSVKGIVDAINRENILYLTKFPKVGEKTAEKIVDTLGNDCLSMISNDYECLLKVPKMTEQKAIDIQRNLNKYNESYENYIWNK